MSINFISDFSSQIMSMADYNLNIKTFKMSLDEAMNTSYELVMPEKLNAWKEKVEKMVKAEETSDEVYRERVKEAFQNAALKEEFGDKFQPDVTMINYQSFRNIMNNKKNRVCALLEAFNGIAGYLNCEDEDKLDRAFTIFDTQSSVVKRKLLMLVLTYVKDGPDFYCGEYGYKPNSRDEQLIKDTRDINRLISQGKTYEEAMEETLNARELSIDKVTFNVLLNKDNNEFVGVDILDSNRIVEGNLLEHGNIVLQISKGKETMKVTGRVGNNSISLKPIIGFGEEDRRLLKKKVELFKAGKAWKGIRKSMKPIKINNTSKNKE